MKRLLLVMAMAMGISRQALAQFCPSCVQNSAVAQSAQFNVSSATVRGPLTVGSINISSMAVSTITAGAIFGGGQGITNLNASQILSGHLSSAAVSGPYPGITSVGAIASGSWQGGIVASPFGGTGANLGTATPGSIPYFASIGTMTALPPDVATYLLQTNGPLPPSWTHAPQVVGTNIVSIPMANLIPGQLPMDISINDASISTVSASKVIGNIAGFSANMVGTLPIGQLGFGTLPNGIPASSITVTGVAPGTYGISGFIPRYTVGTDGRLTFSTQTAFSISPSSMTPGPLPPGVTVPPGNITAGTLPGNVIASSVAATGVSAGTYGGGLYTVQVTVGGDGRATSVTSIPILVSPSSITAGILPYNVTVPPSSILPGALPSNVVASSFNATGVTAGTYGDSTHSVTLTVDPYGRLTLANASPIPGTSTSTVVNNIDNAWQHSQTFVSGSSLTINGNELVTGTLTAGFFSGNGSLLVNLNPVNISAGTLPGNVIASSVAATGVVPGLYGDATHVAQVTVGADGRATTVSSILIVGSAASTVPSTGVLSGFLNPGVSVTTANVQPGFNGASELVQLNASGQLPALDAHFLTALTASNLVGAVPSGSVSFSTITTALGTVGASTFSLQGQINSINTSTAATQTQFNTVATSTNSLQAEINALGASTRTVTSGEAQVAVQDTGLTYKITTVGISSACPNGQAFAQVTSSNGIITGGTCATLGGGSGGSGGWNTTGAVVYLTTGTNNVVIQSTLTVQGGAAGTSILAAGQVVAASFSGFISTQNFTNGFNAANQLVQLNGSGSLPALNAANLTNLTAANLVGAVPSGAVSFSTITTAINNAVVAASNANAWTTSLPVVFLTTATNNVLVQSTMTIQGNAFSVGGSTLIVSAGRVGVSSTPAAGVNFVVGASTLVVLQSGNVGIGITNPNNLLQVANLIDFDPTFNGTYVGYLAGNRASDVGFNNVAIGFNSLFSQTSGNFNDAVGVQALYNNTTGDRNVALGEHALYTNTAGIENTAVGAQALEFSGPSQNYNTAVGSHSLRRPSSTVSNNNTALGAQAGQDLTIGQNNTAIGFQAGLNCGFGYSTFGNGTANTAVGAGAWDSLCTGVANTGVSSNTLLGYNAGARLDDLDWPSLEFSPASGGGNTLIGFGAGQNLHEDFHHASAQEYYNILIGYLPGDNLQTGASNIMIGNNLLAPSASANSLLNIGNFLYGDMAAGKFGINTSTPDTNLNIIQTTNIAGVHLDHYSSDQVSAVFQARKWRGTTVSSSAVLSGDRLGTFGGVGYDGGVMPSSTTGSVQMLASENHNATSHGTNMIFNTTPNGSTVTAQAMMIANSGNVGVGTSSPQQLLDVNGAAQFGSGAAKSTFTATGALNLASGAAVTASGNGGNVVSQSSITTSGGVFGSGYGLTGVTVASCTVVPNSSFSNTAYGVALATVTMTTRGLPSVDVRFIGTGTVGLATQTESCTVLVDGGFSATVGAKALSSNHEAATSADMNMGFPPTSLTGLSAASHSFALVCLVSGNTGTIIFDASHYTQFCATERP